MNRKVKTKRLWKVRLNIGFKTSHVRQNQLKAKKKIIRDKEIHYIKTKRYITWFSILALLLIAKQSQYVASLFIYKKRLLAVTLLGWYSTHDIACKPSIRISDRHKTHFTCHHHIFNTLKIMHVLHSHGKNMNVTMWNNWSLGSIGLEWKDSYPL